MGCALSSTPTRISRKHSVTTIDDTNRKDSEQNATFYTNNFNQETEQAAFYSSETECQNFFDYQAVEHSDVDSAKDTPTSEKRDVCDSFEKGEEDGDFGLTLKSESSMSRSSLDSYRTRGYGISTDENADNQNNASWMSPDGVPTWREIYHPNAEADVGEDSLDSQQHQLQVFDGEKTEQTEWNLLVHKNVSISNRGITIGGIACQLTIGPELTLSVLGKELLTTQNSNETDLFGFFQK
ncbi:uncharacterized protein LOC135220506 [Macrobrachium nipponense]|uniref:uncharacterized protein LOC135220506 n=1 Tax=Macrobrachium nipponense TaxID=159736 RepID=UPI0030C8615F